MINLPIGIFVVMCAAVAVLLYISFVQYRRAEKSLHIINTLLQNMRNIYDYVRESSETLNNPTLRGAFESDDEVGTFFKEILNIQQTLEQFLPENSEQES